MSIALREFWTRLVRSGITDAAGCKSLAAHYSKSHGGTPVSDSHSLAKFLVKSGRLTKYQALTLLATPARDLRIAQYTLRSDSCAPPLSRWVDVTRQKDGRPGVLLRVPAVQFDVAQQKWLTTQQSISHARLQPLRAESHPDGLLVFSPLRPGRCLHDVVAQHGSFPPRFVCELGIAMVDALAALDAKSSSHGAVRLDRVWMADDSEFVLLRSPSDTLQTDAWLDTIDPPYLYAAPELTSKPPGPNLLTDFYSLGCLMFRLVAGRFPFAGGSSEEIAAAHASETPPELVEAVARGESGDPLYRVIVYAMAKNPASRFENTEQFAAALRATRDLLPEVEIPKLQRPVAKASPPRPTIAPPTPTATPTTPPPVAAPPKKSSVALPSEDALAGQESATPATAINISASPPGDASRSRAPSTRPMRRRKKKKGKAPLVLGAMCVAVLMLMVGLIVHDPDSQVKETRQRPAIPRVIPPVSNQPFEEVPSEDPNTSADAGYELVSDDRLLFAPPYPANSSAAPLDLLPPGPAVVGSLRVSTILQDAHGSEIIQAFSPNLQRLVDSIAARAKVPVESIQRCGLAMHPGVDGWPDVSLVIELTSPQSAKELVERWQVAASRTPDGATIYAGESADGDAYFFAEGEDDLISRFAVGSIFRISEVAASEGGPIPLPRSMQRLWESASDQADLIFMGTPNFLFADGRAMLQSTAPEIIDPLKTLLIPDAAAVMFTADLGESNAYAEARVVPSGGISEAALMRRLRDAIERWPDWADSFIVDSVPDVSWRLLAARLPSMMRFVVGQTRFGVTDRSAVVNAYLPAEGVPQIALATLLAMNTPRGNAAPTTAAPSQGRPLTIDEMLDRSLTVSFEQESLEFAIDAITIAFKQSLPAGATMPPIRIIGRDLQLMGITQNQQVRDFSKSDVPLRQVLTDLLLEANADKTAQGPQDPKQALVWVVADDPANAGEKAILVTTRQSADGVYDLPTEFQIAP